MIVKHTREKFGVFLTTEHLPHIARRNDNLIHLMNIAIQTGHVALHNLIAKDIRILGVINACSYILTTQNTEITVSTRHGNVIVKHLFTGEVNNHRNRTVIDYVDAFPIINPKTDLLVVASAYVKRALGKAGLKAVTLEELAASCL